MFIFASTVLESVLLGFTKRNESCAQTNFVFAIPTQIRCQQAPLVTDDLFSNTKRAMYSYIEYLGKCVRYHLRPFWHQKPSNIFKIRHVSIFGLALYKCLRYHLTPFLAPTVHGVLPCFGEHQKKVSFLFSVFFVIALFVLSCARLLFVPFFASFPAVVNVSSIAVYL